MRAWQIISARTCRSTIVTRYRVRFGWPSGGCAGEGSVLDSAAFGEKGGDTIGGDLALDEHPVQRVRELDQRRAKDTCVCNPTVRVRVDISGHARIRYVGNFSHAWFEMAD